MRTSTVSQAEGYSWALSTPRGISFSSIPCGRRSKGALERAIEYRFRFVPHLTGHIENLPICGAEESGTHLEPPVREISEGRRSQKSGEALCQHGARHSAHAGQILQRSGARWVSVEVGQRASHVGIARAGQPARGLQRKIVHVSAQSIDEERLGKFR
jgi:hypothetical protein